MTFVNVEAKIDTATDTGTEALNPKTKVALRRALADNPGGVLFECTDAIGPSVGKSYRGNEIPEDVKLVVTGPHAYDRKWHAQVFVRNGKPTLT